MDNTQWIIVVALVVIAEAILISFGMGLAFSGTKEDLLFQIKEEQAKASHQDFLLREAEKEATYAKMSLDRLESKIDRVVEERVEKRIRSWSPDEKTVAQEFEAAERMAAKREQINAGRSHPPREDGGEPAKVSKIKF